jgi:hypothetical protein
LDPAGRPRKAVGEPSRPVKRAVKKAAKKPATLEDDAAAAAVAEKKRLAKEKAKEKLAVEKARKKQKDFAAAKKAREDAMTPEELAKRKARVLKLETRELKKAALEPPFPSRANSAWNVFVCDKSQEIKGPVDAPSGERSELIKSKLAEHTKKLGAAWKELPASDLEVRPSDLRILEFPHVTVEQNH